MPLEQLRDWLSRYRLLVIHPSMSSGIWWSWSFICWYLKASRSLNRTSRSPISIDPSLYPYVRLITPPSDIGTRTTTSDTGTSTSIRTNESSTDSLSFLLRRRYLSLSNRRISLLHSSQYCLASKFALLLFFVDRWNGCLSNRLCMLFGFWLVLLYIQPQRELTA